MVSYKGFGEKFLTFKNTKVQKGDLVAIKNDGVAEKANNSAKLLVCVLMIRTRAISPFRCQAMLNCLTQVQCPILITVHLHQTATAVLSMRTAETLFLRCLKLTLKKIL